MTHMAALIHLFGISSEPGESLPAAVIRRTDGTGYDSLITLDEHRGLLHALARSTNRAEGAKNIVVHNLNQIRQVAQGHVVPNDAEGNPLEGDALSDARWAAWERLQEAIASNAEAMFAAALLEVDSTDLPDSPDRARQVLLTRLESTAAARSAWVLDAVAEQGAALIPGCPEQATALSAITAAKQAASNAIRRAEGIPAMQEAEATGTAAIKAIDVVGAPKWALPNGTPLPLNAAGDAEYTISHTAGQSWSIRFVANPPAAGTGGSVSFDPRASDQFDGWNLRAGVVGSSASANLVWGGVGTPLAETRFRLVARNDCGPNDLYIVIKNTNA